MLTPIKKILFATTLEPDTRTVARMAASLAMQYRAEIILLHAVEPLGPYGLSILETYLSKDALQTFEDSGRADLIGSMKDKVRDFFEQEIIDTPDYQRLLEEVIVEESHPTELIIKTADHHEVDLIVMGTLRRTGVSKLLVGSVARRVLELSHCPVLIVPLAEHSD